MLSSFGHLLKEFRLYRGMTQKTLAQAINVNGSYIARLEMDDRRPSRRVVLDVAQAMELSPEDTDRLLASAQHLPEGDLDRLLADGGGPLMHPALRAVANAVEDQNLSPEGRKQLEDEIMAYVAARANALKQQDRDRKARRSAHRARMHQNQ